MIELKNDELILSFPDVHPDATMSLDFQRTLRIPDDGRDYPLPAGLGRFPLRHVDDFAKSLPERWIEHGGIMLPMYQSEALWISLSGDYPFAVKVAAGKINALTGKDWSNGIHRRPQDYMVVPEQPWLDGYCVEKGVIRQFVAMPLGSGYSAEEQISGEAEHGGIQILAYPMKREVYERRFGGRDDAMLERDLVFSSLAMAPSPDMGLAAGGRMRQEIYHDPYKLSDWDVDNASRCFVHIANSMVWRAITSKAPPTTPLTSKEYERQGVPWFEYYSEGSTAVDGSKILGSVKSVAELGEDKGDVPLPDNESVSPKKIVQLRKELKRGQVREGVF